MYAVSELDRILAATGQEHLSGHDQKLPAQTPSVEHRRGSLLLILDDVVDIAEIDDICTSSTQALWPEGRVPT